MFEGKSLLQIFQMGGFTMYVLLLCSVISIAVIIERFLVFRKKARIGREKLMAGVRTELKKYNIEGAMKLVENTESPLANVVRAGIKLYNHTEQEISGAMEREVTIETIRLEKHTSIVGTIGNTAVYIGLFGTVLGIIRSFHDISQIGSGGMNVVIGGVSESLICTATGLFVAIPAVIFYNYFVRRVDTFVNEMELCASEIIDLICIDTKKK